MARQMKPANHHDVVLVMAAIDQLRAARINLKDAGATRAVERVRKAIASAEGALRHVHHRKMHTDTETLHA